MGVSRFTASMAAMLAVAAGIAVTGSSSAGSTQGGLIAFDLGRATGPKSQQGYDIYVVHADGSGLRRLTKTRTNAAPTWSPDGRRIAFSCGNGNPNGHAGSDLCVINADGSGLRRLTHLARTGGSLDTPAWSPNGKLIASVCSFDVCLATLDGSRVGRLTQTTGEPLFVSLLWSPDSSRIAMDCSYLSSPRSKTCLVSLADGQMRIVSRLGAPTGWTPDGRIVVATFAGRVQAPPGATYFRRVFWTISPDGSGRRPLALNVRVEGPAWSADGNRFLDFVGQNLSQLAIFGRDGKLIKRIANSPKGSSLGSPTWQPLPRSG